MSRWRNPECCYYGGGYGAYGAYGAFDGYPAGCGCGCNSSIYVLLILILIVLQFGHEDRRESVFDELALDGIVCGTSCESEKIDNSVLFIIVIFLLFICSGCGIGIRRPCWPWWAWWLWRI